MNTQSLADFLIGNPQINVFFAIINENLNGKKFVASKDNEVFVKALTEKAYLKDGFLTEKGLAEAKSIKPENVPFEKVKDLNLAPDFWDKLKKFELPKKDQNTKDTPAPAEAQTDKKEMLEVSKDDFQKVLDQIKNLQNEVQNLTKQQENIKNMSIFDIEERLEEYYELQKHQELLKNGELTLKEFKQKLQPDNDEIAKISLNNGTSTKTVHSFLLVRDCTDFLLERVKIYIADTESKMQALTAII